MSLLDCNFILLKRQIDNNICGTEILCSKKEGIWGWGKAVLPAGLHAAFTDLRSLG
jgi:hypothetical protein